MACLAMRRGRPALNASLTIIVLTPLTMVLGEFQGLRPISICFCWGILIVMARPEGGLSRRARLFRAALPCLALIALTGTAARSQTVTSDLFSPTRASRVTSVDSPLRRTTAETNDPRRRGLVPVAILQLRIVYVCRRSTAQRRIH